MIVWSSQLVGSPDGGTNSTVDFICCRKGMKVMVRCPIASPPSTRGPGDNQWGSKGIAPSLPCIH